VVLLDALTPVKPGMMLSVITTFSAAFGSWVTISATASIEVVTVALGFVPLLFAGVESGGIEVLLAVLLIEVRVGGTVKPIVRVSVSALAIATGPEGTMPVAGS
jgi:hypothetical protein